MKKLIIIFCWMIPSLVQAQDINGIKFSLLSNWNEILEQAKRENKPIFVDAYTTWCPNCRMMDRDVFTNKEVADYVNANFIAVKVQMDSSKNDTKQIKDWYADAVKLKSFVDVYPTYLFFDSNGTYSGKEEGFHNPVDFVVLLKKAIDPKGSYIAQLRAFDAGELNKIQLRGLAYWAKSNKDNDNANRVASAYKQRYVDSQPVDSLLNADADRFNGTFIDLFSFNDKIIQYMYKHQDITDVKFKRWPNYSKNITDYIIRRDYIYNHILSNDLPISEAPEWKNFENNITKDFNRKIAKRLILDAQIFWAHKHNNLNQAVKLEFQKIDGYGIDTSVMGKIGTNNLIYDIVFKKIDDPNLLRKAVDVMKRLTELENASSHSHLDTYASVLYKIGSKQKALEIEKTALEIVRKNNDKRNIKFYTGVIDKMQNDVQIWKE